MSSTPRRTDRSAPDDEALDLVFHALADRTRRSMLARLREGPQRVSVLAEPFDMTLPAASKHIRVLERAGLIDRTVDGRVHHCALNPDPLQSVQAWVEHYGEFWNSALDALAAHLEEDPP
ncbi:MAG: ArsR/SmtB family transcription factor [Nannocystales bacterium]